MGDFDNDGRLDLLVTRLGAPPALLRNVQPRTGNWIKIALVGTRSNRDGMGALVEVTARGFTQSTEMRLNSSYISASDSRLHIGLGDAPMIDSITVRWPSGLSETIRGERHGHLVVLTEGGGKVKRYPLASGPKKAR